MVYTRLSRWQLLTEKTLGSVTLICCWHCFWRRLWHSHMRFFSENDTEIWDRKTNFCLHHCIFCSRSLRPAVRRSMEVLDDGNFCRGISGCNPGAVPFLLCKDHPKENRLSISESLIYSERVHLLWDYVNWESAHRFLILPKQEW